MTQVVIFGTEYMFCRPIGANNADRFNRVTKLASKFEKLSKKFDGMIKRGGSSSRQAQLALACKLMMYTGIRVGNEGSAEGYVTKPHPNSKAEPKFVQTYGLTTLKKEHVILAPRRVCLNFIGKKQVENSFVLSGELGKQVRSLYKIAEETLFDISAEEIRKFIKVSVGDVFTPKDFRTMRANMYAMEMITEISERETPNRKSEFNKEIKEVASFVAEQLNNTAGVCKASYIDPMVWEYFETVRCNN